MSFLSLRAHVQRCRAGEQGKEGAESQEREEWKHKTGNEELGWGVRYSNPSLGSSELSLHFCSCFPSLFLLRSICPSRAGSAVCRGVVVRLVSAPCSPLSHRWADTDIPDGVGCLERCLSGAGSLLEEGFVQTPTLLTKVLLVSVL